MASLCLSLLANRGVHRSAPLVLGRWAGAPQHQTTHTRHTSDAIEHNYTSSHTCSQVCMHTTGIGSCSQGIGHLPSSLSHQACNPNGGAYSARTFHPIFWSHAPNLALMSNAPSCGRGSPLLRIAKQDTESCAKKHRLTPVTAPRNRLT